MIINEKVATLAEKYQAEFHKEGLSISECEGLAMSLLWIHFMTHAHCQKLDIHELAITNIDAFIENTAPLFKFLGEETIN